jgi:cytochrome c oxidase assembly protein subunit 11
MTGKRRTVLGAAGLVAFMGAMSFAAVPLYDLFCRVTGYGGETGVARAGDALPDVLEQTITIRFDASTERGMPWEFRPLQRQMTVRLGETGLAFYEAYNPTDHPVAGSASYNVAPFSTGQFFVKVHCFCFEQQVLAPGERIEMPVSFYVDPDLADDREARHSPRITLSYTFHEIDLPEDRAALPAAPAQDGG